MEKKKIPYPTKEELKKIAGVGDINQLEEIYEQHGETVLVKMLLCDTICKETLEYIISKGVDLKEYSNRILEYHVYDIHSGDIKMLIEHGVEPYVHCTEFWIYAASGHQIKAVKTALEMGYDMYAKDSDLGTAVYAALRAGNYGDFPRMEKIVRLFLEHGYKISEEEKQAFIRQAEDYEFRYDDLKEDSWYADKIDGIEEAYQNLYKLLDITPIKRYVKHDGVSEIQIPEGSVSEQFEVMYNTMVPGRGRAKSMQGEAIRIIGTINVGLSGGRENLNVDEKRMFKHLLEFVQQGNSLSSDEIERVKVLRITRLNDDKIMELAELTIKWISMNTSPFPLPEVTYKK